MVISYHTLILVTAAFLTRVYAQVAPTWTTSNYLQAGSKLIINGNACNCKTGNSSTPTASVTFATAFAEAPHLGYGTSSYEGNDPLIEEMYQITRTSLDASGFSLKMQISGFTHIWVVQIRYVAISKSFPHHLNSFDNVPVNYAKGGLVNISSKTGSGSFYENIVNYTAFCNSIGATYNTFGTPLTNNKILLFLTSFFVQGTLDALGPAKPVVFYTTATPLSTQTFKLLVNVSKETMITRLHFSMITFDSFDVQGSGKYLLIYQKVQFQSSGGFYPFPIEFLSNFMIALTQFSSTRCVNIIHFILKFQTVSGSYGVQMPTSNPRIAIADPLKSFVLTVFYIKTWICPNNTIFDPSSNMCVTCTISNCVTCHNLTNCSICNQAANYFLNPLTGLCEISAIPGCLTFTSLTACSDCNQSLNYVLAANFTCTLCNVSQNYFAVTATQTCQLCSIPNCLNCSSLTLCSQCNTAGSYYLGTSNTCQFCNSTLKYLIDPVTKNCVLCTIPNCLNCSTLTACGTCNSGYLKNATDNLCYVCTVANCITCSSLTACSICNSAGGYGLNTTTGLCQLCSVVGCLSCTSSTTCGQCNTAGNYIKTASNTCQLCAAGTFANNTTNTCVACTLSQCLVCSTLTTCNSCNTTNSYYLNAGTCSFCDPSTNKFINTVTFSCQTCTLAQCTTCFSLTACTTCTAPYLLNATDKRCYLCSLTNCVTCLSLGACSVCTTGFTLNTGNGLCQSCSLVGCVSCINATACATCDTAGNYILLANKTCQKCTVGLFANSTLQTCDSCTLVNCTTCTSLTVCSQCNHLVSAYLLSNNTCGYCDPATNKFINLTTFSCQSCIVTNCLTCDTLTTCTQCNPTYFLNSVDKKCYSCSVPNCVLCASLTTCSICDTAAGYALNTGSLQCQLCTLVGCTNCSSTTTCVQCDTADNYYLLPNSTCKQCDTVSDYFLNVTTMTCELCPLMPICLKCSSLSACISCDTTIAYYLNSTTKLCNYCNYSQNRLINPTTLGCQLCTIPNCLNCSTLATCQQCDVLAGFFLDPTTELCVPCSVPNCLICNNLTSCNVCDYNIGYTVNLTTELCQPCTLIGCTNCSNTQQCIKCSLAENFILLPNATCFQCNSSQNLFANQTSAACQFCVLDNCLTCTSLTTCISCNVTNSYYLLPELICEYCNNSVNQFINFTNLQCEACSIQNCINCSSLFECRICNEAIGSFVNLTDFQCYPCTIPFCFKCDTLTMCQLCDQSSFFFLNTTTGLCEPCTLKYCVACSSLTRCSRCDQFNNYGFDFTSPNMSLCGPCNVSCFCDGYGLPWREDIQKCTPICGDGLIRQEQQCDDGNSASGDGCSNQCKYELFYTCISEPSICNQTIDIIFKFVSIQKTGCNQFKIVVFSPLFTLQQIYNYFWISNQGVEIIEKTQKQYNFEITAQYTRDLTNQTIQLDFWPGQNLNITYNPELVPLYYSEQECKTIEYTEILVQSLQIISYILLFSSLFSCKIVGLQLFGVMQLAYFSLSEHSFLNIYLAPLIKLKSFNGFNTELSDELVKLPDSYQRMSIVSNFINNCNIMLFLMLVELLVSCCLFLVGKLLVNQKVINTGQHLMKQGFITIALFNIFNIAFSAGVHWKYAQQNDPNSFMISFILYGVLTIIVGSVIAMQFTSKKGYGQFKDKFKQGLVNKMYIPFTMLYRISLGFYLGMNSEQSYASLVTLSFCFIFLMYFFINLPFSDFYQNYRAGFIHLTMFFTLLTANYYRIMKSNTPIQVKGRMYTPAIIQIAMIVSSVAISTIILTYEIYLVIEKCKKGKVQNRRINSTQTFENRSSLRQQGHGYQDAIQ